MADPGTIPLPSYAYVPGQSPRHAEGTFDHLTRSVRTEMTVADLAKTAAWQAGFRFLDAGYYWEAHEMWEPVWMQTLPASPERNMVQGLIQIANARLKHRMQRPRAVLRLCDLAEAHLRACGPLTDPVMQQVPRDWITELKDLRAEVIPSPQPQAANLKYEI